MSVEWPIILATLMGPILAVQAQKWIERARERRGRRAHLFHNLMATRAARLLFDHVRALNMIDIEFYPRWWRPHDQKVIDAWHAYQDVLSEVVRDGDETGMQVWAARRDELFIELLYTMSRRLGYKFDKVRLKRGAYTPRAHGESEFMEGEMRENLVKILKGEQPINVRTIE